MVKSRVIKNINILFLLVMIFITLPVYVYGAGFKKGDKLQFKEAATLYVREQNNDGGYKVTKAKAMATKGDKVTFQGEITTTKSIYDFSSASALRNKDIALITYDGKEYIVLLSTLEKVSSDDSSDKDENEGPLEYDEDGSQTSITDAQKEKEEEQKKSNGDEIYKNEPSRDDSGSTAGSSINDLMGDAESFLNQGNSDLKASDLQEFSSIIYNIFLTVGIVVAVIVGGIIGIKLMASNIETKVEAKKLLVPYIVGCAVVFGAFAIWKIVIIFVQGV